MSIDTPPSVDRQRGLGVDSQKAQRPVSIDTHPSVDRQADIVHCAKIVQRSVSIDTQPSVDRHTELSPDAPKPQSGVSIDTPTSVDRQSTLEVRSKTRQKPVSIDTPHSVDRQATESEIFSDFCTPIIKMPKKLKDPGSFVLNVEILNQSFERSLCDIGSGVNLMPSSVAKNLGMTSFTDTSVVLVLADRSCRIPEGVLEDVPVKVGSAWIPTDFIVLDYDKDEPKDPLILGRPFLATAGALIDCRGRSIELRVNEMSMIFEMDKTLKRSTIDGQTFTVTGLDEDADIAELTANSHPSPSLVLPVCMIDVKSGGEEKDDDTSSVDAVFEDEDALLWAELLAQLAPLPPIPTTSLPLLSDPYEIQRENCKMGNHDLRLDEEIGTICNHCSFVETEIRHMDIGAFWRGQNSKKRRRTSDSCQENAPQPPLSIDMQPTVDRQSSSPTARSPKTAKFAKLPESTRRLEPP